MILFEDAAKRLGYEDEEAMWKDLYVQKRQSITALAVQLDVSRNTIRSALLRFSLEVRGRGGANNTKTVVNDALIAEIRKDGVMAVAARLNVNYTTLYKRLRRAGVLVADLQPETSDETSGDSQEKTK